MDALYFDTNNMSVPQTATQTLTPRQQKGEEAYMYSAYNE